MSDFTATAGIYVKDPYLIVNTSEIFAIELLRAFIICSRPAFKGANLAFEHQFKVILFDSED